jgi:hypothetical protein
VKCIRGLCFVCLLAGTGALQAQTADDKSFAAPRVDRAPHIDGRMEPGEWDAAARIDDFHELAPVEFSEPEKPTVAYVMYTRDALYVAVHSYDDPANIVNKVMRQGSLVGGDDAIFIVVDPSGERRSGYSFVTNVNGIRSDGLYISPSLKDLNWNGIWDTAGQIVEDGWIVEVEIPFKTMNIDPDNSTWAFNLQRNRAAGNSSMAWSSRNGGATVGTAGSMTGMTGVNQGIGLDVIPSVSVKQADNVVSGTDTDVHPSLDMRYKITPQLNLTLTLNTDFAATEVDSIQLDTGRFSPLFPEKRSFFLTDTDVFNFGDGSAVVGDSPPRPFHSRTIGLADSGEVVDLIGGAKLSGRVGDYNVGALAIRQDAYQAADATNIVVGRIKRGILNESDIGLLATSGDPHSNDESTTLAADFNYRNTRLPNNRALNASVSIQKSNNPGIDSDDVAWNAQMIMPSSDSWFTSARLQEIQKNFDPRLGFNNRVGVRQYAAAAGNTWIRHKAWLRSIQTMAQIIRYNYLDTGTLQSVQYKWNVVNLGSFKGDSLGFDITREQQVLRPGERAPLRQLGIIIPPGNYEYNTFGASLSTSASRPWSVTVATRVGEYFDTRLTSLNTDFQLRPSKYLSFDLAYNIERYGYQGNAYFTRVIQFNNTIAFSSRLSLVNTMQYDNVSDVVAFNSRFNWNMAAGKDIWFIIDHSEQDTDGDGHFSRVQTSASAKISYTFRF